MSVVLAEGVLVRKAIRTRRVLASLRRLFSLLLSPPLAQWASFGAMRGTWPSIRHADQFVGRRQLRPQLVTLSLCTEACGLLPPAPDQSAHVIIHVSPLPKADLPSPARHLLL